MTISLRSMFAAAMCALALPTLAHAQNLTGTVILRVTADSAPIADAPVATKSTSIVTDHAGRATFKLPTGTYTFRVTPPGFRPESLSMFVGVGTTTVSVPLRHAQVHRDQVLPPVAVAPPTTERLVVQDPTHVEIAGRAAIDQQLEQSPGIISDLLDRMAGVRIQPLTAGSAGAGIRIRGLPGRYSKILMDGLPLAGDTPEGQDPFQISALGVDRVEVTPGITSAFYGPTALSGTVNVVSAGPSSPSQAIINGTSRAASDVAVFQTQTFSPTLAATLMAGRHYRGEHDPDGDGWAEVAGYKRVEFRPRVYWTRSPTSNWFMTGGWMSENRRSGTFRSALLPDGNVYSDDADTRRGDAGTVGRIQLDTNTMLTVRASLTREWRTRWFGEERERNRRDNVFGDVAVTRTIGNNVLSGGVAMDRDQYVALDTRNDYRFTTPALYAEHTWTPDPRFGITSSARLDLQSEFGDFVSPRVSVFVRPASAWSVRLSRANGVYAPTPVTDETEALGMRNIEYRATEAEHALGWSLDLDGTTGGAELRASAYRTDVTHPLTIRMPGGEGLQLIPSDDPFRTQGADVSARYRLGALTLTGSYSYVDATRSVVGTIVGVDFEADTTIRGSMPYTPRHSARFEAALERENDRTLGVEIRFTGPQTLADSSLKPSQSYVTLDARAETRVRRAIVFARASNLTNVHQAQFAPVLRSASGSVGQWADNVWAPLDGFVLNLGVRMLY